MTKTRTHILNTAVLLAVSFSFILVGDGSLLVHAQTLPTPVAPLTISLSTQHPKPGDSVVLRVSSLSADLSGADITWTVDGTVLARGVGKTSATVTAGDAGTTQRIAVTAVIETIELRDEIFIRPSVVDLLWESPRSYTPPFYKGKTLFSQEAPIRVIALPQFSTENGSSIPSKDIVFTWEQDGVVLGDKSGTGKNVLLIEKTTPFRSTVIRMTATSLVGGERGASAISITPTTLNVVLYEKNPLLGILFNRSLLNTPRISSDEISVRAYPYFSISSSPAKPSFSYEWTVNNTKTANPGRDQSVLVLRKTSSAATEASVRASLADSQFPFQSGQTVVSLRFTDKETTPFTLGNELQ